MGLVGNSKGYREILMGSRDVGLSFISAVEHFAIHGKRSSENQNLVFIRPLLYWVYLGAAKIPVRFNKNKTVNPVR